MKLLVWATKIASMGLVLLAAGCGGGGSGGSSDKDCKDFTYQQDAQAWHQSHPNDGLDSDGDGIACESLSSRPGGSGGSLSGGVIMSKTMIFDVGGTASLIENISGTYLRSSLVLGGSGGADVSVTSTPFGGYAIATSSGREYVLRSGVNGGPARNMVTGETAYAWPVVNVPFVTDARLSGTYNYLGKRCTNMGCVNALGQILVDASSATVSVCPGQAIANCSSPIQQYNIVAATQLPGVYRISSNDGARTGFVVFGNATQGAVGFAVFTQDEIPARLSAFAARQEWAYKITDQATLSFSSITIDGLLTATSASTLAQGAILDQPLPNFFGKTGQPGALSLVMQSPARVLSYDGSSYTFWAN